MITAVIPIRNEAKSIKKVMGKIMKLPINRIIPVINGCTDCSLEIIKSFNSSIVFPIFFEEALGIDVPRSVGAKQAFDVGSEAVLFIDGDMEGVKFNKLRQLIFAVLNNKADLGLSNCYPENPFYTPSPLANYVINIRKQLNTTLKHDNLGTATPSHGPHIVSRRVLKNVPFREFAVPPVMLAHCVKSGLKICAAAEMPHPELGSPHKDPIHSQRVAETIIGDCIEAMNAYQGKSRHRSLNGINYIGYNQERRWDLLNSFLQKK